MSRAVLAGSPGTDCSSSREAARIASGEPKWESSARLRAGPTPGSSSSSEPVIALSRRPFSLEFAKQAGADETLLMDDHWKILEQVKALTDGKWCERVIECTGLEWPLNLAGEMTAERGRLVIAGYHQDGMRQVNVQLWNWRGLDVINAHERDPKVYIEGIRGAVDWMVKGIIDPRPLYTHRFTLDKIMDAYTTFGDAARSQALKVIISAS